MSAFMPVNPRPMLLALVGKEIRVRLKWGYTEYTGALVSADSYMNLQLANTEEFINGESQGTLGQVLIRCNNVLWISAKDAGDGGSGAKVMVNKGKARVKGSSSTLDKKTAHVKREHDKMTGSSTHSSVSGSHSSKAPVTPATKHTTAASPTHSTRGSAKTSSLKRERGNDDEGVEVETPVSKRIKHEEG